MHPPLHKTVAWICLAQVALVGALGTGLHSLLGCEHGPTGACTAGCCKSSEASSTACTDCVFCRHAAEKAGREDAPETPTDDDPSLASTQSCGDCAVCELLSQYHSVTPFAVEPLSIELASGEATVHHQNAVIAAAIRLAHSRGPPVA